MTRLVVCSICRKRIPSNPRLENSWWITKEDTSQERVCKKCYWSQK